LDGIGRSAARFDFAKLENLNGHYLRATPDAEIVGRLKALLPELPNGAALAERVGEKGWRKLKRAMPGLKERAKTLVELLDSADYLFAKRPLELDDQANKLVDAAGRETLSTLLPRLEALPSWKPEALEAEVRAFAGETGRKLGKVAQPLRAALTGKSTSPAFLMCSRCSVARSPLPEFAIGCSEGRCLTLEQDRMLHCEKNRTNMCGSAIRVR